MNANKFYFIDCGINTCPEGLSKKRIGQMLVVRSNPSEPRPPIQGMSKMEKAAGGPLGTPETTGPDKNLRTGIDIRRTEGYSQHPGKDGYVVETDTRHKEKIKGKE